MSLLIDMQIRGLCVNDENKPVESPLLCPFSDATQGDGVVSYGVTHAGYDLRLGFTVDVFKNSYSAIVDPKVGRFDAAVKADNHRRMFDRITDLKQGERIIMPPHSYILAYSLEYIRMPRDLKGRCVGKSTYARCGVVVNTTPLEPGWHGHLTIEIANVSPCPVAIYAGEGIAQLEFEQLAGRCMTDYAAKGGKYQGQAAEPVSAKVKE